MYTYTRIIAALLIVLTVPVHIYAVDTETVGSNTYTHIQTCYDRVDIFINRTALNNAGFSCNFSKLSEAMGDINLVNDIASYGNYGGVLLWASHGGTGWVACQCYPYTDPGMNQAVADANLLMQGASFQAGDLDVYPVPEAPCYAIALTNQGIASTFGGDNAIALIAACYASSTGDNWGGRVKVSYSDTAYDKTSQSHMTALLDNVTATNNYNAMTIELAMQSGQTVSGDDDTSLLSWVTSYSPSSVLDDDNNVVTVNFGTKMNETSDPFTVGSCSVGSNEWNGNSQAAVEINCSQITTVNVKLEASRIKSSKGIFLKEDWSRDYDYTVTTGASWGAIKSMYYDGGATSTSGEFAAGAYEPRSSQYNRLAWSEFAPPSSGYNVMRSVDDDENMYLVGNLAYGDTVFIDSTATTGHTYDYRVVTLAGDSLCYTDEMSFGLLTLSELYFYDINGKPGDLIIQGDDTLYAEYVPEACFMIADGQYIYLACKDKVKKIDVTDPENPVEVGSRDISSFPYNGSSQIIKDMSIGYYDGYLFVLTELSLIVINKTTNDLPIVSSITDFDSGYYDCIALSIMDNIAYVATTSGIYAVSFHYPADLEIWGTYTGMASSEGNPIRALERVDDYLYVEIHGGSSEMCFTEILDPSVYEIPKSVYFDVVCTDHDSLICLGNIDLTATTELPNFVLRGNPMGYYATGRTDDTTLAVYNVTNPLDPSVIKTFVPPWAHREAGGIYGLYTRSYTFDDQYVYISMYRWTDNPWSAVYVFDLYSPEPDPIYAMGDLDIGQRKSGTVTSWGEHLYYFDKARDDRDYHRLQIFEKPTGCDPNLNVVIGPDPIADIYEVGQTVVISWTCTGCPTRIDIKLVEDGSTTQTIESLRKYEEPDLQANSINWIAEGISPDPDNHTYKIKVQAWNIEGAYDYCWSNTFEIVEELGSGDKEKIPIIAYGDDDEEDRTVPLPDFATESKNRGRENYLILPENPKVHEGEVLLTIRSCEEKDLLINSIELIALDVPSGYEVTMKDSEPQLTRDGEEFIPLRSIKEGTDKLMSDDRPVGVLRIAQYRLEREPTLQAGESMDMAFTVAAEAPGGERRYILVYSGLLVDAGVSEEEIPKVFALIDPYPNPFNATTTIEFHMPRKARAGLHLYDASGRLVRTLKDDYCDPGVHKIVWDGRNDRGGVVASGIYFCKLTIEQKKMFTKKLVLLR